jgi:hypothetical protein
MRVVLFDARGAFDVATVTDVAGPRVRVQHGRLSSAYDGGADGRSGRAHPSGTARCRDRRAAARAVTASTERPVVDNVVDFHSKLRRPSPPRTLAPVAAEDSRPATSASKSGAGAAAAVAPTPSPVPLDPALFGDGPWCPNGAHAAQFDADLLHPPGAQRLRVQVAVAACAARGTPVRQGRHVSDRGVLRARSAGRARRDATQPWSRAVIARATSSERGIALVAVMSASSLLLALGLSLALTTTIEVGIAANQRDAVQTLHAADAALERAIADLALADWMPSSPALRPRRSMTAAASRCRMAAAGRPRNQSPALRGRRVRRRRHGPRDRHAPWGATTPVDRVRVWTVS